MSADLRRPLLLLLLVSPAAQALICGANAFASGGACAPCAQGTFSLGGSVSATQCRPSAFAGPTDTVFSFSGDQAEGVGAYSVSASIAYVADRFGSAQSALSIQAVTQGSAPLFKGSVATIPSGSAPRTISLWQRTTQTQCSSGAFIFVFVDIGG